MRRLSVILLILLLLIPGCSSEDTCSQEATERIPEESSLEVTGDSDKAPAAFTFDTIDHTGEEVTLADFSDASVIMINLWEPWCGPCVSEMPHLEQLYETYKDQGFVIIGAYATFDQEADVDYYVESLGITYPIVRCDMSLFSLQTEYVPTTVFIDASGNLLSSEPYIGAKSYEEWETILKGYLK